MSQGIKSVQQIDFPVHLHGYSHRWGNSSKQVCWADLSSKKRDGGKFFGSKFFSPEFPTQTASPEHQGGSQISQRRNYIGLYGTKHMMCNCGTPHVDRILIPILLSPDEVL